MNRVSNINIIEFNKPPDWARSMLVLAMSGVKVDLDPQRQRIAERRRPSFPSSEGSQPPAAMDGDMHWPLGSSTG